MFFICVYLNPFTPIYNLRSGGGLLAIWAESLALILSCWNKTLMITLVGTPPFIIIPVADLIPLVIDIKIPLLTVFSRSMFSRDFMIYPFKFNKQLSNSAHSFSVR